MKLFAQIVLGAIALVMLLLARGMQLNPHAVDQIVGMVLHFLAALFIFFFFFYWRRTAIGRPASTTHYRILQWVYFVVGVMGAMAVIALLLFGSFGGEIGELILSLRLDFLGALVALAISVASIAVAFGMYSEAKWAGSVAKIVAFPLSYGWPIGFAVALYTWWALRPSASAYGTQDQSNA